jgi:small glutamine-rich tetratricopeptide repeat-containing protein alpha
VVRFPQFLDLLREKDFFKGVPEGSLEHAKRMEAARAKFEAKYATAPRTAASPADAAASPSSSAADAAPAAEVTAATKAAAEAAKNEGNALLGKGDHTGAVAKYSEAIRLNPAHAIYYANRAAAHVNLKQYSKAADDARDSIRIDPAYPKSHYRLGQSLAALGEYEECLPAFERALALSSKDEGMAVTIREQIRQAKAKLNASAMDTSDMGAGGHTGGADPFAALGGMGGLGSMLSGLGGGGAGGMDFGALLNNPAIAQMMQNPAMGEMMKNLDFGSLMKDPAMGGMMGSMAQGMANAPQEKTVDTGYTPPPASALFDDDDAAPAAAPAAAAPAPKPAAAASSGGNVPPALASFLATPAGRAAAADPGQWG